MRNADRVLILGFEDKTSDSGDNEITRGSEALEEKAKSIGKPVKRLYYIYDDSFIATSDYMLTMNRMMTGELFKIEMALAELTNDSELILRGHGNATYATLSKIGGAAMANFLVRCGLKVDCKINITACKAARGSTQLGVDATAISAQAISEGSFARSLMSSLLLHGRHNEVHARVQNVRVHGDGKKTTRTHGSEVKGDHQSHQPCSKIIFKSDAKGEVSCAYAY